jgi:hypothetical protein
MAKDPDPSHADTFAKEAEASPHAMDRYLSCGGRTVQKIQDLYLTASHITSEVSLLLTASACTLKKEKGTPFP